MGVMSVSTLLRVLGYRGFASHELEAEFQSGFRVFGIRFLHVCATVSGAVFLAFWAIDTLTGRRDLFESTQLIRFCGALFFLLLAQSVRHFGDVFIRHYAVACSAMVCLGALLTACAAHIGQIDAKEATGYWVMMSAIVLGTLMSYGFARLRPFNTLVLGGFMAVVAMGFATVAHDTSPESFERMAAYLLAGNAAGYLLYRFAVLRGRRLFLRARRKRHVEELRRTREEAESANRAKTAFLANMSHEIRTPMNGVIGALSMLNIDNLTERDRLFVKSARDSARNLLAVLNGILDFAKLDAHQVKLTPVPFDPRETVTAATEAFRAMAMQKGLHIGCDLSAVPPHIPRLLGDEGKLRQVLLNLISNAVKFTQQGRVLVSAAVKPIDEHTAHLLIDVSDTGIGIPDDAIGHLCQPFYQVESGSTRSHGGTGLGLAICKQIVEEMGGGIAVRSVLGVGTTFEIAVNLPRGAPEAPSHEEQAAARSGDSQFGDSMFETGLRLQGDVLLVEDNDVNAFIASMTLESLGVRCHQARNGQVAVDMFRNQVFGVILMDCEMPVMDGYEAVRRIREIEALEPSRMRTPVVALTAHALSGDREACLERGMDDYLTKPFDRQSLAATLSQWLPAVDADTLAGSAHQG